MWQEIKGPDGAQMQNRNLIPLTEIREKSAPVAEVGFKTVSVSIVLIVFGGWMLFLEGMAAKIGGIVFAGIGLFGLLGVKDHITAKLYEDSVTLIDHDTETGVNLPYCDIAEWNIDDGIQIRTKDGAKYAVESFACGKALKTLREYLPEQETRELLRRRRKQEKVRNPLDLFWRRK